MSNFMLLFFNFAFKVEATEYYKFPCFSFAPAPGKNPLLHLLHVPPPTSLQTPANTNLLRNILNSLINSI